MDEQWSDNDSPLVSPDAKFRQDLARALQDTHQRQRVQRHSTDSSPARRNQAAFWAALSAISLLILFWGVGYYFRRRTA